MDIVYRIRHPGWPLDGPAWHCEIYNPIPAGHPGRRKEKVMRTLKSGLALALDRQLSDCAARGREAVARTA